MEAALCFTDGARLPWRRQHMDGVLIDGPRSAAALAARRGELPADEVEVIALTLDARFPPA